MYTSIVDVLSNVIAAMRIGRPHSNRHQLHAPWGIYFPTGEGGGFHVVLQGSCWFIPPADRVPIALGAGDVVFVRGPRSHGLADNPATPLAEHPLAGGAAPDKQTNDNSNPATTVLCGAYMLNEARLHPLVTQLPEIIHLPAHVGRHTSLRSAIDLLGSELERPRQGTSIIVPALLDALLLYILRSWISQQAHHDNSTGWVAALHDPAITSALTAIHDEPARPWTVGELGAHAGMSRAAFARRFNTLIGQPPLTYLTWWRMTTSARLLRESEAPLRVIARQVGYTSEVGYAAAFKREYGITPGQYRHEQALPSGSVRPSEK
jgi:AraC-like DNA-binding protein